MVAELVPHSSAAANAWELWLTHAHANRVERLAVGDDLTGRLAVLSRAASVCAARAAGSDGLWATEIGGGFDLWAHGKRRFGDLRIAHSWRSGDPSVSLP